MKPLNSETIRVWTSIVLTITGALIALALVISSIVSPNRPNLDDAKWASAMSLAVAAMGGGVSLAQSIKGESNVNNRDTDRRNK